MFSSRVVTTRDEAWNGMTIGTNSRLWSTVDSRQALGRDNGQTIGCSFRVCSTKEEH